VAVGYGDSGVVYEEGGEGDEWVRDAWFGIFVSLVYHEVYNIFGQYSSIKHFSHC